METEISQRKAEHLEVAQLASSQSLSARLWDHIRFEPNALPELDLAAIDSSLEFLDRVISCPLLISSMSDMSRVVFLGCKEGWRDLGMTSFKPCQHAIIQ